MIDNSLEQIIDKVASGQRISAQEALLLYEKASTDVLMSLAHDIRCKKWNKDEVTWQIDRNVNITNVCVSGCKFCNFHVRPSQKEGAFITSIDEYRVKIEETLALGGDQLLLQGGLHPKLGIHFYEELFSTLKREYPTIKLHALGPAEVAHIARISSLTVRETLVRLVAAGLESLPGAGAEILDSEVRKRVSPAKISAERWLEVIAEAHRMGLATSATMMYGHVESLEHRIMHLVKVRELQDRCTGSERGFLAFIPWPYCGGGTRLEAEGVKSSRSVIEYLRLVAISRIVLDNIASIQASWLTVGVEAAQLALHGGANDLGSIMIEENVVRSTGIQNRMDRQGMKRAITQAGFIPKLRGQDYQLRDEDTIFKNN